MLFSDLLKFIILSPLSHTQDPFPASVILSTEPIPLVHFKTPLFLIAVKEVAAQMWCASFTHWQQQQQLINTSVCFVAVFHPSPFVVFDSSSCSDQKI